MGVMGVWDAMIDSRNPEGYDKDSGFCGSGFCGLGFYDLGFVVQGSVIQDSTLQDSMEWLQVKSDRNHKNIGYR